MKDWKPRYRKPKHGMTRTRPYRIWQNIKNRCYNIKHNQYKDYGGRGIKMCDRWLNSFESFWKDMQIGYKDSLQIDRIDNNKSYEPGNCRWVTALENHKKMIEELDKRRIVYRNISRKLGGNDSLVGNRLQIGWTLEKATTTPVYRAGVKRKSI